MNRYLFWIRITAILQLITSGIHSLSFFRNPVPANETERELFELMKTYRSPEMGPFFHPSMHDLLIGLSAAMAMLYLLGGLTNLYLLQRNVSQQVWKGLTSINLIVFGGYFLVALIFTFLPPVILTGLVFISLSFAYATNHIHRFPSPQN